MPDRNAIGLRGESIVTLALMKPYKGRTLFRVAFLGDKWPTADCVVELVGGRSAGKFFFIQAKATSRGYEKTKSGKRLNAQIAKKKLKALASYKAPTYLLGLDVDKEKAYLVSTVGKNLKGAGTLTCAFPLNSANRKKLWDEVTGFWGLVTTRPSSKFLEPRWK